MNLSRVKLQRRPFLTPIWLIAGTGAAAFVLSLFIIWEWGTADATTVIVLGHAEEARAEPADPKLSAAGAERAQLLARMFGAAEGPGRLDAIYASNTLRSRLTAEPLAQRVHLPLTVTADTGRELAHRVLREHGGGRVLIVAREGTLPALVASLSGIAGLPEVHAEDYGIIYVITVPRIGHANLLRLNY
jgi:broad specificity phosphatase PhoE